MHRELGVRGKNGMSKPEWPNHLHYPDCPWVQWERARKSGMFRGSPPEPGCTCGEKVLEWLKKSGQMRDKGGEG